MKILLLHSDFIEWEPKKKAISSAEEIEKKPVRVEDALVVFSAVEKLDQANLDDVVKKAAKEIISVRNQVNAKNVVVYPYAHLSSDLSSPDSALYVLKGVEEALIEAKVPVKRAPFGWYKAFDIKCKGHPLSELSRDILPEGVERTKTKTKVTKEESFDYKQLMRDISKTRLDKDNLKDNDHRILGQKMDLFSFSEVAPGMVFWHDKGLTIYNELISFWREQHRKAGYQEISTPQIMDKKLWQISGHWEKYQNNFITEYEGRSFAVKPMNCPGGMMVYKNRPKSYKDLPLRVGELGVVHRQELSGVLTGLFRVIRFTQDDAHIFCTEEQLESEIGRIMELVDKFYKKFGFEYHVELSTRPEKRIGDDKIWDKAEAKLEETLKHKKMNFKINKGDGAFYGPKIDYHIKDSQGRTWQCATIQLDFAMPERFDLTYKGEDNEDHRPVMLHRVIYGSLERFIGILLEHFDGNLPVWLSPVQVRVLSFTDRNNKAAGEILKSLENAGIRAECDLKSNTVEYKVRDAAVNKIPFVITIGDKEEKNNTLAVRTRDGKVKFNVKIDDFISEITKLIKKRESVIS
ncbi:MAG: threonine--tRNA ligase [Candidatus Aenigmatarchaeota archaeon]